MIKPGAQGYLLEIPKIGVRAVVKELERLLKRFGVKARLLGLESPTATITVYLR